MHCEGSGEDLRTPVRNGRPEHGRLDLPEHDRLDLPEHDRLDLPEHGRLDLIEGLSGIETDVVGEIGRIVTSDLDIGQVYEGFALAVKRLIPFERAAVDIVNRGAGTVSAAYVTQRPASPSPEREPLPMEDTHTGLVCRTGAPLVIGDISQDKRFTASSGLMAEGLCSILLVPLVARGVVVATFSVASRHSYAYGDRDRWALERLAPYISFAIENARLREEASQRDREIDVLATVQKNILELIAGDTPLIHVLEALCRFVEGQSGDVLCAIALPNPEEDGLDRGAAPSFHETFVDEMEALPLGPSWTSLVGTGRPASRAICSDIFADPLWERHRGELLSRYGIRACWSTPIFSAFGQALATLAMFSRTARGPNALDFELMRMVSQVAAVAIESRRAQRVSIALMVKAKEVEVLRQVDRIRKELISTVAHEIRNPLASIKGYISTLLQEDIQWEPQLQREFLSIANQEADRLNRLVGDLLTISWEETGVLKLDRQVLDMASFLKEAEAYLSPLVSKHALHVTVHEPVPRVWADKNRIMQVIGNLVANAAKYSSHGSRIYIEAASGPREAVVQVRDQGDGIPAERLERIFEPFYRIEGASPSGGTGFGLSLSICRSLVKAHGGSIWVESEVGRGSAFFVTLPMAGETVSPKGV